MTANKYGFKLFEDDQYSKPKDFGFIPFNAEGEIEPEEESFGRSVARTALQVPSGLLQAQTYPLDILKALGTAEALDPEEIEHLKKIYEREGVPFDEEKYRELVQTASEYFPTQGNVERILEKETGIPLEARTKLQKGLKLGSTVGKITPGTTIQKGVASAAAPLVSRGLQETGIPEPLADIAGGLTGGLAGIKTPAAELSIGKATKPSGLTTRRFEKTETPKTISESRLGKINEKVESDFKSISDKIIKNSPVGETFENLKNNPTFKQESRELLSQAQEVADKLPEKYSTSIINKELNDISKTKRGSGYLPGEYDKAYEKYVREMTKTPVSKITAGDTVKQYRKNNAALSEYFEPGQSKAVNRAKRDALLDHNRALVKAMEKEFPNSELVPVFKEGNERWTKIMDAEAIDSFIEDIFSDKKINFKDMHKFFDKEGYSRSFKRALGDEGFKNFEQLMKDMLSSETPYKMLKIAKEKGFQDLFNTGAAYLIHPKLGAVKSIVSVGKNSAKYLLDSLLDKPQLTVEWKSAVDSLKKGKFVQADKAFKELDIAVKKEGALTEALSRQKKSPLSSEAKK